MSWDNEKTKQLDFTENKKTSFHKLRTYFHRKWNCTSQKQGVIGYEQQTTPLTLHLDLNNNNQF